MVNQDRAKQERLLNLAGWLHTKHNRETLVYGESFTEVRFERQDFRDVPALSAYSADTDAADRMFYRDTADLALFGIEVLWVPAEQVWASRVTPFTDEEFRALAVAALSVLVEEGVSSGVSPHVPGAGLSVEGAELLIAYAPITDQIITAIQSRVTLIIEHRGLQRKVDPWHVFLTDGRWYLFGRDHRSDDRRVFALDAIDSVESVKDAPRFLIPKLDLDSVGRDAVNPDTWVDGDEITVDLQVDARLAARAENLLDATADGSESVNGWIPMTCTIRNVDAFIVRLWGLRARAVVISPPTVRAAVVRSLEEMV